MKGAQQWLREVKISMIFSSQKVFFAAPINKPKDKDKHKESKLEAVSKS